MSIFQDIHRAVLDALVPEPPGSICGLCGQPVEHHDPRCRILLYRDALVQIGGLVETTVVDDAQAILNARSAS